MMTKRRTARINVKLLVILSLGLFIVGVGVIVGHKFRKRAMADTALNAGNAAWERQDYVEASKQLRQYLSKYPDDADILERYAEVNLAIRPVQPEKIGAAIGAYRRLLRQRPDDPRLWKELVKIYAGIGQHNEAAYICRQRLDTKPDDVEALYWWGKSLFAQRKTDEAREALSNLVALGAHDASTARRHVQAYQLLAGLAQQTGGPSNEAQALEWLDRAIEKFPDAPEAYVQRSRFHRSVTRNETAAKKDLETAQAQPCDDPGVRIIIIEENLHWGQFEAARKMLADLHATTPQQLETFDIDPEAWVFARYSADCRLAKLEKNFAEGIKHAEAALAELRDFRRLSFIPIAVELYLAGGRREAAQQLAAEYQKGIQERVDISDAARDQAVILAATVAEANGDDIGLINLLDAIPSSRLNTSDAWRLLWRAFDRTGQSRRALQALEEYVARSRRDPDALKALAKANRERNWSKVVSYAGLAERLRPDDLEATALRIEGQIKTTPPQATRGTTLQTIGDELARLRAVNPHSGTITMLEAGVAYRQSRADEAIALLHKAVDQENSDEIAALALVNLLHRTGRSTEAIEACKSAIQRHPKSALSRLRLAELLEADQKPGDALSVLETATRDLAGDEKALAVYAMAQHLTREGDAAQAEKHLSQLATERPHDLRPRLALLELPPVQRNAATTQRIIDDLKQIEGEKRGLHWRVEQARQWIREAAGNRSKDPLIESLLNETMAADPHWSAPVLVMGEYFEQSGRTQAAESLYKRFLELDPDSQAVAQRFLTVLESQDRFDEAEEFIRRLPPNAASLRGHRLQIAMGQGNHTAALAEVNQKLIDDPKNPSLLILKAGLLNDGEKEMEGALKLLDEARQLDPQSLDVFAARASILHSAQRDTEARAILDEAVGQFRSAEAHLLRARLFTMLKATDEAERDLRAAVQLEPKSEAAQLALGRFLQQRGNHEQAVAALDDAIRAVGEKSSLQRALVEVLLASPDAPARDRGTKLLESLRVKHPHDVNVLRLAADWRLKQGGNDSEATALLEQVVTLDPRAVPAHLKLIELAQTRGDRRGVEALMSRALTANPNDSDLQLMRADLEAQSGNLSVARELARSAFDEARRAYQRSESNESVRRRVLGAASLLVDLALRARDAKEALRVADEAAAIDQQAEVVRLMRARVLEASGQTAEAISGLEEFRAHRTAAGVQTMVALAELYLKSENHPAAEAVLNEAATRFPHQAAVGLAQLRWMAAAGRWDDLAVKLAAQAKGADPRIALLGAALITDSPNHAHLDVARKTCDSIVAHHPDRIDAQLTLAQVAYRQKDLQTCEGAYRRILQLEPFHPQALNDLAWVVAVDLGKPSEGLPFAEKGALRYPDDVHLLDTRGVVLSLLDRLPEARRDFERCLGIADQPKPSRARTLFQLGRVLVKQGELDAARARFREIKTLNVPDSLFTEAERNEMQSHLGS